MPSSKKKNIRKILDNKILKIIAAKKADIEDSIVFIIFNEKEFTGEDAAYLQKITEQIDAQIPSAGYFPVSKNIDIEIYDKKEFKNRDVLVTINADEDEINKNSIQKYMSQALGCARSVEVVFTKGKISVKP